MLLKNLLVAQTMDSLKLSEKVCRICLKQSIEFNWNDEILEFCGISYKDCYYKYTQLEEFDSDCYPTSLCEICANKVKNAHMLFEKALESFNILQTVITTKQLENKYFCIGICETLPARKCEIKAFDEVNKPLAEIEDQICISPLGYSEGIAVMETEINDCNQVVLNKDVSVEPTFFIDIQHIESSAGVPLEQHLSEIYGAELPKLSADKKAFNKRKKHQSVPDIFEQQLKESCNTKLPKSSSTNKVLKKRRKCESLTKSSLQNQLDECYNNELPNPLDITKTDNKTNNIKSLTVTSLEQNRGESCDTISVLPATKSKRSREKRFFICAYCSLKVGGHSKLATHEATHTVNRKRTETCPQCGIKLYTKLSLTQHMKTHDENRQKNHKCEFCEKAFFSKGGLNVHRRIHLGLMVKCQLCTKEFFRQVDLDKHLLTHSVSPIQRNVGQKKYTVQCQYCNKSVLTVKYKTHIAQHLGQPEVKCKVCDKNFYSRTNCTNHLRRIHHKSSSEYENLMHYYGDGKTRVSILKMKQQLSAQPLTDKKCAELP